jgi:hypothetical protein
MIRKAIVGAIFVASLTAVAVPAAAVTDVRVAPPPPREELAPAQRHGYVWAPGHWEWRRGDYHWVNGAWLRARHGYHYSPNTWVEHDGHWHMERGHWQQGDRDHDGVPNRYDRAPDNPNRK